jgi:replicative DNA helicase
MTQSTLDQLPPHAPDIEKAVLGSVLTDPACLDECRLRIKTPLTFYESQNQEIYDTLCKMSDDGETIDTVTLYQRLRGSTTMGEWVSYISALPEACHSPENISQYVADLMDVFLRRRFIQVCTKRMSEAQSGRTPAETIIEQSQAEMDNLHEEQTDLVDGKKACEILTDDLQRRYELAGALSGVPTGFVDFDKMTDGLQYGDQTIIASRPSIGKTALALNIFHFAAVTQKIPSLFVSLEMGVAALMRRLASHNTEMTMNSMRKGSYTEGDFKRLTVFTCRTANTPVWFLDGVGGLTIGHLCAEVRRAVRRYGIRFVVVDYLQRILPSQKSEKRTYEVGNVSTRLCGLADETDAAFLTLAQLNRENEKGTRPRPPRLSDLGDSKQIEQDADTVGLLHRDRSGANGKAYLIVAKQRDGETGAVELFFNGPLCRFENQGMQQRHEND